MHSLICGWACSTRPSRSVPGKSHDGLDFRRTRTPRPGKALPVLFLCLPLALGQLFADELFKVSKDEQSLVDLANAERKKAALTPLEIDPVLMQLAREQSARMARLDMLSHSAEGLSFVKRLENSGYRALNAGENIAEGARSPAEATALWMISPGHKANILHTQYTRIGVAVAKTSAGSFYWTQVFARPAPKPAEVDQCPAESCQAF